MDETTLLKKLKIVLSPETIYDSLANRKLAYKLAARLETASGEYEVFDFVSNNHYDLAYEKVNELLGTLAETTNESAAEAIKKHMQLLSEDVFGR